MDFLGLIFTLLPIIINNDYIVNYIEPSMTCNTEQTGSSEELLSTNIAKLFNALLPLSEANRYIVAVLLLWTLRGRTGSGC